MRSAFAFIWYESKFESNMTESGQKPSFAFHLYGSVMMIINWIINDCELGRFYYNL